MDGALRVTVPPGGSRAGALRFAQRHLSWALRERARLLSLPRVPSVWTAGTMILMNGQPTPIELTRERDRTVARVGSIATPVDESAADLRPAIERKMRSVARQQLAAELHAIAATLNLRVSRISIRNQQSRWGSCSCSGWISLNFRLIQMPPSVREYILVHELMHLRQPNHSPRFWVLVESVCPDFRESERWLKKRGRTLF